MRQLIVDTLHDPAVRASLEATAQIGNVTVAKARIPVSSPNMAYEGDPRTTLPIIIVGKFRAVLP